MAPVVPSQAELDRRKTVGINLETITETHSTDYPGHWPGEDHAWDLAAFRRSFSIRIHKASPAESSFSLIGIDASIANAFRRILIAEIPTLAIETVFVSNNTSVIQDEVLAHRLGLIPFRGGKNGLLSFLKWFRRPGPGEEPAYFDFNTVRLELRVACTRRRQPGEGGGQGVREREEEEKEEEGEEEKEERGLGSPLRPGETDPRRIYRHAHVYARDIRFLPSGRQASYFSGADAIAPVNPDVLIAKMRPGQAIDIEMLMHKGTGADHAKFSPVATASYRLLPSIDITRPILGADADKFATCFPPGVIGIETVTADDAARAGSGYEGQAGERKAVVADPMRDTVSRECLRHPEFEGKVRLGRVRDHFIFSIESTGQWDSDELFLEAVKHLKVKCERLESQVVNMIR